jgi:hypothetical protein
MALASEELAEIGEALASPQADAGVFAALRARFPHLSWTRCDASDVAEAPFRSYPGFDLHLVDRSDHCVQITSDPARATGIVLAVTGATP